jgi:hypothetical protein
MLPEITYLLSGKNYILKAVNWTNQLYTYVDIYIEREREREGE